MNKTLFKTLFLTSILVCGMTSCSHIEESDDAVAKVSDKKELQRYADYCTNLLEQFRNQTISSDSFDNAMRYSATALYNLTHEEMLALSSIVTSGDYIEASIKKVPTVPLPGDNNNLNKDPYVVKIQSDIEKALATIKQNSTETYYILAESAVYNDTVYWSLQDIVNDPVMTVNEKYGLISVKATMEKLYIEAKVDTTALHNPMNPGIRNAPKNNPKQGLTTQQAKDYELCIQRYKKQKSRCWSTSLLTAAFTVGTYSEESWLVKYLRQVKPVLLVGLFGVYIGDLLDCLDTAKADANMCLQDKKVPRRL